MADADGWAARHPAEPPLQQLWLVQDETRLVEEVNKWVLANIKNRRLNDLNKKYFGSDLPELIVEQ